MTAAYFQSLALAGVAVATALSLGIAPLSVAGYTAIRTRRMPAPRILAALAAGTAGLALVCGAPQARTSHAALACGVVLAAVSGVAFAALTIVNRRVVPGLTPVPLLGISFVLAGLISLAWSLPAGIDLGSLNGTAWGALGVLTSSRPRSATSPSTPACSKASAPPPRPSCRCSNRSQLPSWLSCFSDSISRSSPAPASSYS